MSFINSDGDVSRITKQDDDEAAKIKSNFAVPVKWKIDRRLGLHIYVPYYNVIKINASKLILEFPFEESDEN